MKRYLCQNCNNSFVSDGEVEDCPECKSPLREKRSNGQRYPVVRNDPRMRSRDGRDRRRVDPI